MNTSGLFKYKTQSKNLLRGQPYKIEADSMNTSGLFKYNTHAKNLLRGQSYEYVNILQTLLKT